MKSIYFLRNLFVQPDKIEYLRAHDQSRETDVVPGAYGTLAAG